jgi:hypothetical protein
MPRYFFEVTYHAAVIPDRIGIELENLHGVREEVLDAIRELGLADLAEWSVKIVDEFGVVQLMILASEMRP